MYQTFKPYRENRAVGVSAAVAVTALAAIGISSGLAREIILQPEPITEVALIDAPENTAEPVEVIQPDLEDIDVVPDPTPLDFVIPNIVFDIPIETPIVVAPAPEPVSPDMPVVSGSNAVAPKLIVSRKPAYPPPSIRAQEEGVTTISVCVNERGQTQSAQLTSSSGFSRLDDAALKWMKSAKFRPARADGKPRAVCNHIVAYEWNLEDAR